MVLSQSIPVWLGGLLNPEAYITATRQCVAQANSWSLEELHLQVNKHFIHTYFIHCINIKDNFKQYTILLGDFVQKTVDSIILSFFKTLVVNFYMYFYIRNYLFSYIQSHQLSRLPSLTPALQQRTLKQNGRSLWLAWNCKAPLWRATDCFSPTLSWWIFLSPCLLGSGKYFKHYFTSFYFQIK